MSVVDEKHPDPETLAAFAEGAIDGRHRQAVVDHLDHCEECMSDVALAMTARNDEPAARRPPAIPWLLAAAAVLLMVISIPAAREVIERPFRRSSFERLVALAPRSERVVEPRLSGGFAWAEYHGPERAHGDGADAAHLKLGGAAGEVIERAAHAADAESQHAAGVAMLLVQRPLDAVARLEAATQKSDKDAKTWSDLAAARSAAASSLGRASLYPQALAAADTALRLDAKLPEALFNRALILEKMGLTQEARHAWQRYLDTDASSAWANEARTHLAELPAGGPSSRFERERPLLEKATESGDQNAVRTLVDGNRERARAYAEAEYLGRWGEAVQRGDDRDADRWLTTARWIGDALASLSGESLLRDAVRAVDQASEPARHAIAGAHVLYRQARIAYSRQQVDAAERDLRRAGDAFAGAGDPMAFVARYYAASARLARSDSAGARADLEKALTEADAHPQFIALGAHVRWELARARMAGDDWAGAVPVLSDSSAMFRRLGERASEAFIGANLAAALTSLGRTDDAWGARISAFRALSVEGDSGLLAASVTGAMRAELELGRLDSALALSSLARVMVGSDARPLDLVDLLAREAMLQSVTGDDTGALATAHDAEVAASAIPDEQLRARALADVAVADGAALLRKDPQRAAATLSRSIDFYRAHDLPFGLPEPLLLRSRAAAGLGDPASAQRDLAEGIGTVERHALRMSGVVIGTGALDAENALFSDAIRLSLDRGDNAGAFSLAERWHGETTTVADVRQRLAGSATAVLEIVVLSREIITFALAHDDFVVSRRQRAIEETSALAASSLSKGGTAAAATLYDDIVRPVEGIISRAREIVFVPDPHLAGAPFAALYDSRTRQFLIERVAIAIAPSAGSLRADERNGSARSIVTISLPSGSESDSVALPDAEKEIAEAGSFYRQSTAITGARATAGALTNALTTADVIHIAGHTERQPGAGDQALLFATADGRIDRLSSKAIVGTAIVRPAVIVLAACETLRPAPPQTHAISLGGAFSVAGAADVVGTLMPVPDRDARTLLRAFHRRIAAGEDAAGALREAQLEAIHYEEETNGSRAWRAFALMTRRFPAAVTRKAPQT